VLGHGVLVAAQHACKGGVVVFGPWLGRPVDG